MTREYSRSVDDPMFTVFSLCSCRFQTGDIASCKGLGNSKANELLARQNLGNDFFLNLLATKIENRREANKGTGQQS